jgi:hypothetical protein
VSDPEKLRALVTRVKPLTVPQKKLAEKAIRARFKGLRNALSALLPKEPSTSYPSLRTPLQTKWHPKSNHFEPVTTGYPPKIRDAALKLQAQVDEFNSKQEAAADVDSAKWEAQIARHRQALAALDNEMEEAILRVHFDGTGQEMLDLLDGLPRASDVVALAAAAGIQLDEESVAAQLRLTSDHAGL